MGFDNSIASADLEVMVANRDRLTRLLAQTACGDVAAFEMLYHSTRAMLIGCAQRFVHGHSLAEEIVQECYTSIWYRADTFDRSRGTPMTWMFSIVRNRAIDRLRQVNGTESTEMPCSFLDDLPSDSRGPEELASGKHLLALLMRCVSTLPEKERDLIQLAFFEGLTHVEIAQLRQLPLGTVKSLIRRGLQSLREQLDDSSIQDQCGRHRL